MTDRSQGISGTEIAALFGMSPYLTRVGVYGRKKGLLPPEEVTPRMRVGKLLEPVVVNLFEEKTGRKVTWEDELIQHPKEPIIIGTPDGSIEDATENFEAKTAGIDRAWEWGDTGDHVPVHYIFQQQWYLMLRVLKKSQLAVLIGGNDFRTFELSADEELQAMMLDEARRFWHDHIEKGVMPEADYSEASKQILRQMYPSPTEGVREATPTEEEHILGILQTRKELKFLEQRKETLQNQLRASLGFAKGLTSPHGKVSLTKIEPLTYTVERKAGDRLNIFGKRGGEE